MKQFILLWLCLAATAWGQYVPRPTSSGVATTDFDTLSELNTILTDADLASVGGANTFSFTGTASTPAIKLSGVPFAGTGTTSFPLLYINDANATASTVLATAGTYLGVNGDGTQDLINLLKDGVSMFKVTSTGTATFGASITLPINTSVLWAAGGGIAQVSNGFYQIYNSGFSNAVGLRIATTGLLEVRNSGNTAAANISALGLIATGSTFANLPTSTAGTMAYVTDGATGNCGDGACTAFGTTVTGGGGSLKLLVWYNGTNWTLIGK